MFRSEVGILTSTAHLAKFVKMTSSPQLLNEFVYFILGDNTSPEKPGDADHKIRHRLIERCDHLSDEASNSLVNNFEDFLQDPTPTQVKMTELYYDIKVNLKNHSILLC